MYRLVTLVFMLLICKPVFSQCPIDDVYLLSQEDVINFITDYPNCETILGDLVIADSASDISNLKSIKRIEGSLIIIGSQITSVANFQDLDYILENIYLEDNRSLETIEGINKLRIIGGDFIIFQPGPLQSIKGFNSLETIEGSLIFEDNFRLNTVEGFENLISVNGTLSISDNLNLISISEFKKWSTIQQSSKSGDSFFIDDKDYNHIIAHFNKELVLWAESNYGSLQEASRVLKRSESALRKDKSMERLFKLKT